MSRFISGKDEAAVENLLSQAKDLYVLEQVAKINCSGFTDETALPTNLETRFRRLKSLPVSRPEPVSSSSRKLLSHSKSMASYPDKKNRGNVSSVSAFSNIAGKSCPLDSSVEEKRIFSGIKGNASVKSRGDFSDSVKIGWSSSRFSRESKVLTPTTQTLKLLPKEKSRISPSSSTSSDLASPSSDQDQKERSNQKSKSKPKFLHSWFDKLSPAQAMGCLRLFSRQIITKQQKDNEEQQKKSVLGRKFEKGQRVIQRNGAADKKSK